MIDWFALIVFSIDLLGTLMLWYFGRLQEDVHLMVRDESISDLIDKCIHES